MRCGKYLVSLAAVTKRNYSVKVVDAASQDFL